MTKPIVLISIVAAILLLALTAIYWLNPANALPQFIPGYDSALTRHHYTHGVGTLILALGALSFAWFQSGQKSPQEK